MKYAFAGDRKISYNILEFLISKGHRPSALFVSGDNRCSHCEDLIKLSGLSEDLVFRGNEFKDNVSKLKSLNVDYIFGIHFPYIIPNDLLELPKIGFLNLHPAFLPYNKGWHTPSWAIIDGTKYGATLHFMSEKLDEGNIIHQKEVEVSPLDTADSLYKKALELEEEVFKEAYPDLVALKPNSFQQIGKGTSYTKKDLSKIQEIDLDKHYSGKEIINLLRALTTNKVEERAYFEEDGKRYFIGVSISEGKEILVPEFNTN